MLRGRSLRITPPPPLASLAGLAAASSSSVGDGGASTNSWPLVVWGTAGACDHASPNNLYKWDPSTKLLKVNFLPPLSGCTDDANCCLVALVSQQNAAQYALTAIRVRFMGQCIAEMPDSAVQPCTEPCHLLSSNWGITFIVTLLVGCVLYVGGGMGVSTPDALPTVPLNTLGRVKPNVTPGSTRSRS